MYTVHMFTQTTTPSGTSSSKNREFKHDVYGKRQTVGSCVSQKHENLRFSTCLTLLRSYSIYLGNRKERSLNKSSFSVFWQKENLIVPFVGCRKRHA